MKMTLPPPNGYDKLHAEWEARRRAQMGIQSDGFAVTDNWPAPFARSLDIELTPAKPKEADEGYVLPKQSKLRAQVGGDHYSKLPIQPLEYIMANGIPFAEGAVIKYVTRWRSKNGLEDLRKALQTLEVIIEHAELHGFSK